MDAVLLCGGRGTRLFPDTADRPKALLSVGDHAVLDLLIGHIIREGVDRVVICAGYQASHIVAHVEERSATGLSRMHGGEYGACLRAGGDRLIEVVVADTGVDTPTGARIQQVEHLLTSPEFLVAYGDVLGDVALSRLLGHHRKEKTLATITTALVRSPFGHVSMTQRGLVLGFREKPLLREPVNIGFMIMDRKVCAELSPDSGQLEYDLLRNLAADRQLSAYLHDGHFERMDTVADRRRLEGMWARGELAWLGGPSAGRDTVG